MAQLAVIGAGNMAEAIVGGAIRAGLYPPAEIVAADVRPERCAELAQRYGIGVAATGADAAVAASFLLLSVKPQNLAEVGAELAPLLSGEHTVVTVLAGKTLAGVRAALGGQCKVIRVMPNLPALVGAGMAAIAAEADTPPALIEQTQALFATVGAVVTVDESLMDAVTAISGSGPGYVFLMIEALIDAALELGFDPATAKLLATQTFFGAGQLAASSDDDAATLRQKVSSPGGTTLAGLEVLEQGGLRALIKQAAARACERARELGRG